MPNSIEPSNFATRIDALADEFEEELRASRKPRVEDFAKRIAKDGRDKLILELIRVEFESLPDHASVTDYCTRFSWLRSEIENVHRLVVEKTATEVAKLSRQVGDEDETLLRSKNALHARDDVSDAQNLATIDQIERIDSELATTPQAIERPRFLHYELISEIARGGMGVVYKARDTRLNRIVALKMILSGNLASDEERLRFQLEAEAAAKLDHPCITPVYEFGEHEGQHFFAMKMIEGGSLADRLKEFALPQKAARLVADIADAIHHAHQRGTLHRDLKPSNILLDEHQQPMVTDFGLAKLADNDKDMTRTGAVMGTPGYMPPEQAIGDKNITTAADVFSLGAILYATLTGRPPFQGESAMETILQVLESEPPKPSTINPQTPVDLELIAMKCLERDPDKRYSSAAELANDLESWLSGEPISIRAPSVTTVATQWMKHNVRMAGVSLIIGILAALIATPICLMVFLDEPRLPGTVYDQLPNASRLPFAGQSLGVPVLGVNAFGIVAFIGAILGVSSAGAISIGVLKPKTMNESVGIGIISGIAVSISLFLTFFGWFGAGSATTRWIENDIALLSRFGDDAETRRLNDELILWRYPDLESVDRAQWRNLIAKKIDQDATIMIGVGNVFASVFTSMFLLPIVFVSTFYFRLQKSPCGIITRIYRHLEYACVIVLLSAAVVWLVICLTKWLMPNLFAFGPTPQISSMVFSVFLLIGAAYACWYHLRALQRGPLVIASVAVFASLVSSVLPHGDWGESVMPYLLAEDFETAAKQTEAITRTTPNGTNISQFAVVLAARSGNRQLHQRQHKQFLDQVVRLEERYSPWRAPTQLEALLLMPEPRSYLGRINRLIEYVERFSGVQSHGTNWHFVMALAAYRAGDIEKAREHLGKLVIGDGSHYFLDEPKSYALRAIIEHEQGQRLLALRAYRQLMAEIQSHRDWANTDDFDWERYAFYVLETLETEARTVMDDGNASTAGAHDNGWLHDYATATLANTLANYEKDPENVDFVCNHAEAKMLLGDLESENGDNVRARQLYTSAKDLAIRGLDFDGHSSAAHQVAGQLVERYIRHFEINEAEKVVQAIVDRAADSPDLACLWSRNFSEYVAKQKHHGMAARWYEQTSNISRTRNEFERALGIFFWVARIDTSTIFYHYAPVYRDDETAYFLMKSAEQSQAGENHDQAIAVMKRLTAEFTDSARWQFDLFKTLHIADPSRAKQFLASLKSQDLRQWKRNRDTIKWVVGWLNSRNDVTSEIRLSYQQLLRDHLAATDFSTETKQRILAEKPWILIGPFKEEVQQLAAQKRLLGLTSEAFLSSELAIEEEDNSWKLDTTKQIRISPNWGDTMDIAEIVNSKEPGTVFGRAILKSDETQDVRLVIGNDVGVSVWLNKAPIFQQGANNAYNPSSGNVDVQLNEGENELFVKIAVNDAHVFFRLVVEDTEGWPADVVWMPPSPDYSI